MSLHKESLHKALAGWALDDVVFEALAEAGRFAITERTNAWVPHERSAMQPMDNVEIVPAANRSATAAAQVADMLNPNTPIALIDAVADREINDDVRACAKKSLQWRIAALSGDDAVALVRDGCSEALIGLVAMSASLENRHLLELYKRMVLVTPRWSGSGYTVRAAKFLGARDDLSRFSHEALMPLVREHNNHSAMKYVVRCNLTAFATAALDDIEAEAEVGEHRWSDKNLMLHVIATMPDMGGRFYERVLHAAEEDAFNTPYSVVRALGENTWVPWGVLKDEVVSAKTIGAIGRALSEVFKDDPVVWLLAAQLSANWITVGELVEVLCVTCPQRLAHV
jgi:hypothetical protein